MLNFQAVAFGVILSVVGVGVGVDYHQQTLKADKALGELTIGGYFQTISGRFSDVQQAKAAQVEEKARAKRQHAGARLYLPAAPDGWTRREWVAGDNSAITMPAREMEGFEQEALDGNAVLRNLAAASEKRVTEDLNNKAGFMNVATRLSRSGRGSSKNPRAIPLPRMP